MRQDGDGKSSYCLLVLAQVPDAVLDTLDMGHSHFIRFGIKGFCATAVYTFNKDFKAYTLCKAKC